MNKNISFFEIVSPAVFFCFLGFMTGCALFFCVFWYWRRKSDARVKLLIGYLEKINTGGQGLLMEASEDELSKLQDEIYKTVTTLYQTRDAALTQRNCFAENLSNIAHQLKTPITAISLSLQMAKERMGEPYASRIESQIGRLVRLEESLLLMARIDSGTLALDRKPVDVFTLLTLAADNLYELSLKKGVAIDVPEMGTAQINVDLEWTMEAVMNLIKNCMEAGEPSMTVHCAYERNPLYVQIKIWDEGEGFSKEDFSHLFERFYRGKNAKNPGIGIGLSISKTIVEMQNGILRAYNLPKGGACFEICFYSH